MVMVTVTVTVTVMVTVTVTVTVHLFSTPPVGYTARNAVTCDPSPSKHSTKSQITHGCLMDSLPCPPSVATRV
jgi:hypothetical protein